MASAPMRVAISRVWAAGTAVGIAAGTFSKEGCQTHFLEEIQVVVGGGAIGADSDIQTQIEHALDRRDAGGQFHVG